MIYTKRWLEYYEGVFGLDPNQDKFFNDLCNSYSTPAKFLSVECGPAVLSKYLSENLHDITVTDSIPEFINILNDSEGNTNSIHAFNVNPTDISLYFGKNFFNVIACCNYRLIFLNNRLLIEKLMLDAKSLLSNGGTLVLDLVNFTKYDISKPRIDLPVRQGPDGYLYSYVLRDSTDVRYYLTQTFVTNEGKEFELTKHEAISPVSLESLQTFAKKTGYSSLDIYSDYNGSPYKEDADKIICVLRK